MTDQPPPFLLRDHRDHTGASGSGDVGGGVMWSDGTAGLLRRPHPVCTSVWASLDDMLAVHGRGRGGP